MGGFTCHPNAALVIPTVPTTFALRSCFVTKDDLKIYLKKIQSMSPGEVLVLKFSYHQCIAAKPYPKDYVSLKFMLFNAKKGSAKEDC